MIASDTVASLSAPIRPYQSLKKAEWAEIIMPIFAVKITYFYGKYQKIGIIKISA